MKEYQAVLYRCSNAKGNEKENEKNIQRTEIIEDSLSIRKLPLYPSRVTQGHSIPCSIVRFTFKDESMGPGIETMIWHGGRLR